MTRSEKRLLVALAWMCEQYLSYRRPANKGVDRGRLDHMFMGAGERAIDLAEYGLVEPEFRRGAWTEAGRTLLNSN